MIAALTFQHGIIAGVLITLIPIYMVFFVKTWFKAFFSGAPVRLIDVIGMRLRGTPIDLVIKTYIAFRKRDQQIALADIEVCCLAHPSTTSNQEALMTTVEEMLEKRKDNSLINS